MSVQGMAEVVQWRFWFPHAQEDMMSVQWRNQRPSDEEIAAWRDDFHTLYLERRTVHIGCSQRVEKWTQ